MTLLEFLVLLLIAGVCGSIGQALAGFTSGGCLVSVAVGFIGALIGAWIARSIGMSEVLAVSIGGTSFPIVWSIVGSALFVALLGLLARGRAAA